MPFDKAYVLTIINISVEKQMKSFKMLVEAHHPTVTILFTGENC